MRKVITLIILSLIITWHSEAQVKFSRETGLTAITISYSRSEYNNQYADTYSGQVNIAKNNKVGIGFLFAHSIPNNMNGFGISAEISLFHPDQNIGLGANVFGAGSIMFSNLFGPSQTNTSTLEAGTAGLELYLHTAKSGFEVIPFVQISKTFLGRGINSLTGYAGGVDILVPVSNANYFVMTVGAIATDNNQSSLEAGITFCITR